MIDDGMAGGGMMDGGQAEAAYTYAVGQGGGCSYMNSSNNGLSVTAGPDEDGMTARGVLRRARGVSQRLVRKIMHGEGEDTGALYVNGVPARFKDRVKAGDEIRLVFPKEKSWIEPQEIPLTILYEDSDILVIDKPPGVIVHPTKGHRDGTIANAVVYHMNERGEDYKPRFVSRLDMGTSGVLLIGKNSHAQDSLAKQNAAGSVEKIYLAVLEGRLEDDLPPSGLIDLPIGLVGDSDPRRAVIPEAEGGYPSQTEYEVVAMAPAAAGFSGESLSVVRIRLITGRTHQIRVHFSHFGHPVLGDSLYGSPSPLIARQALHAAQITFAHPVTGNAMSFTAPLPDDIAALLDDIAALIAAYKVQI